MGARILLPLADNSGFLEALPIDSTQTCPRCQDSAVAFLVHRQELTPLPKTVTGCLRCV